MKSRFRFKELIKQNAGVTLIELLIAFVVFGVMVVAVTPVFKEGNDFWQVTQAQVELRQNLNSALQLMSRELRQAKPETININAHTGEIVRFKYDYSPSGAPNSFNLTESSGDMHYIEFNSEAVTAPHLINVTDARVVVISSEPPVYRIEISGEYTGRNKIAPDNREDLNAENRKLTVETKVVIRNSQGLEEWREDI